MFDVAAPGIALWFPVFCSGSTFRTHSLVRNRYKKLKSLDATRQTNRTTKAAFITKGYYEFCIKQMPKGAIQADLTKHAPHNSYSPPMWYVDEHQKCVVCGVEFTFTAKQQQHWFEVLKIPIHVIANRCAACRRKRRDEIAAQKQHMAEMAKRPRHPNEAFFRKKTR